MLYRSCRRRSLILDSLDGEHDRLLTDPNKRRSAYLRSRRFCGCTRGIYFPSLPRSRTHTLSHCVVGLSSVRFARDRRLRRMLFLVASPRGSHHPALGCSLFAHASFHLAEHADSLQHIRNVGQRVDCMEHNHLTKRWSEPPPGARSQFR